MIDRKGVWSAAACLAAAAGLALAQPRVNQGGVLNAASYALDGQQNDGVAQGSVFVVFGSGLAGAGLSVANQYPLSTQMGGTSIRVTSGGASIDCYLIYTTPTQVAALLPSRTPVGSARLRLTFNGAASNEVTFKVVDRAFGIFTQNSQGTGQASVQNYVNAALTPLNALTTSIRPGGVAILWGTGLGGVAWDESGAPVVADLGNIGLRVWVGAQEAQVLYKGRAGCCAGIDQINFYVPQGTEGCNVPVYVQLGNRTSNFAQISVAGGGGTCPELAELPAGLFSGGSLVSGRLGFMSLTRLRFLIGGILGMDTDGREDLGSAAFLTSILLPGSMPAVQNPTTLVAPSFFPLPQARGCGVIQIPAPAVGASTLPGALPLAGDVNRAGLFDLDAGETLTLTGPTGTRQLPRNTVMSFPGLYIDYIGGVVPSLKYGQQGEFLNQGRYTISSPGGTGTAGVGPFRFDYDFPAPVDWTNVNAVANVTRANGQTVRWTGGPANGSIVIQGFSVDAVGNSAAFKCVEPVTSKEFTIPAAVLQSLPARDHLPGLPYPYLMVGATAKPVAFPSPGLDYGNIVAETYTYKTVSYK